MKKVKISVLILMSIILSIPILEVQNSFTNSINESQKSENLQTSGIPGATIDSFTVHTYTDDHLYVSFRIDNPIFTFFESYQIMAGWALYYFEDFINIFNGFSILEYCMYYDSGEIRVNEWGPYENKPFSRTLSTFNPNKVAPTSINPSDYGYPSNTLTYLIDSESDLYQFQQDYEAGLIEGRSIIIGIVAVELFIKSLLRDSDSAYSYIKIQDDDNSGPSISATYYGEYTDANPGYIRFQASDPSGVYSNPTGYSYLPHAVGTFSYTFTATDNDNDWGSYRNDRLTSSRTVDITLHDDDSQGPTINFNYYGDGTDGNPGYLVVSASDYSGISEDPSGTYYLPNTVGTWSKTFYAVDNDNDRPNDKASSSRTFSIVLVDDDNQGPAITCTYHGDYTDGNPGYVDVYATDPSGISQDPSGVYYFTPSLGLQSYTFEATDNDNDRPDDFSSSSYTFSVNIIDDDDIPPEINYIYHGDYTDGNPGYIEVIANDQSGLSVNPSGDYYLTPILGNQEFYFEAIDNDNDRPNDNLISDLIVSITIQDDDLAPPELSDLIITPDIFTVNASFNAIDQSGIGDIIIIVNGDVVEPIYSYQIENRYYFVLSNDWLFSLKNSEINILVTDVDDDRPDDSLTSSISGDFENPLISLFGYIDWQISQLIEFIDEHYECHVARKLIHKLLSVKCCLHKAYELLEDGKIKCSIFYDSLAKCMVSLTEFKAEIFNRKGLISDDHFSYISNQLHMIRNNIYLLMGISTGKETGYQLASIGVSLDNLRDYVDDNLKWCCGRCISCSLKASSNLIEISLIKIARDQDPSCLLNCVKKILGCVLWKINHLLHKGKISEDIAYYLISNVSNLLDQIENLNL